AQAAAAFFYIGFDDERTVAIAAVSYVALRLLGGDIVGGAGLLAGSAETRVKFGEQRRIARDMPRIEQRRADRGVLGALNEAVLDRARGVAHFHAEVPQEVKHVLDDLERLLR